jgi:hypothetical protein
MQIQPHPTLKAVLCVKLREAMPLCHPCETGNILKSVAHVFGQHDDEARILFGMAHGQLLNQIGSGWLRPRGARPCCQLSVWHIQCK